MIYLIPIIFFFLSFIVPVFLIMGVDAKICVGTSSFIASFSSLEGFLSHIFKSNLNFVVTLLAVISVILGSQAGSRFMAAKVNSRILKKFLVWFWL